MDLHLHTVSDTVHILLTGRIAAKRKLPVLFLPKRPKISIFALQGRLVAPIHVKFGTTERHVGPLGRAKFLANRCPGMGTRPPKWLKISLFGKESPRRGVCFDRFLKLLGHMHPIVLQKRFKFDLIHFTGYGFYC